MELYLSSAPLIRTGMTSAWRLSTQAAKLAHALQYRWRSAPQDLRQAWFVLRLVQDAGRDGRSFGGRCCGIQACFPSCCRHVSLDVHAWSYLVGPSFGCMSKGSQASGLQYSMTSSQNLDRSSSSLASHVSVNQMSNSTLLRWRYVWSGRVGMNKCPDELLSSIQPEHRTPGHGSSYEILACSSGQP